MSQENSDRDRHYMQTALALAGHGLYTTDPNPRVGCVLVRDEKVVGQGWTQPVGGPHAEIRALAEAGANAKGSTCYVTLEPCAHTGHTPPCVDALIAAGIGKVVMAVEDPDSRVAGGGTARLRQAGIEVIEGVLEAQARALNVGFFSRHERQRPWVRLKTAQSLDGGTALADGESQWITGQAARADGHHWRARASAVMTGIGTVLADDPALDARVDQPVVQPLRCILDRQWRTPATAATLQRPGRVLVFGSEQTTPCDELKQSAAELIAVPEAGGRLDLEAVMDQLLAESVNELHIEAGATLSGSLLAAGWVDELLVYLAPCILGDAARGSFMVPPLDSLANRYHFETIEVDSIGSDLRWRLRRLPAEAGSQPR